MAVTYYAILTAVGAAKLANAAALGTTLQITQMAVGDGNGNVPVPDANRTTLVNEVRRAPLNQLKIDPSNASQIIAEQVIPESVGGWWIREIGLLDNTGALIAISNCAPSYKPQLAEGSGRTQTVRMVLIVNNTGSVELKIDPGVVLATREYCDNAIIAAMNRQDAKASVRAATTANIALNGLQTVDGVVLAAGDRVLVKNQGTGSQNGIYVAAAGAWARSADADENAEVTPSLTVSVESGATQADTVWQLITDAPIVVGTTALVFQDITNGLARLASPSFTGNPTAPTPQQFANDDSIATTRSFMRLLTSYSADSGIANAYVVNFAPAAVALFDGMPIHFTAANANTGAATLQLNAIAAKAIVTPAGAALVGGEIATGSRCTLRYNSSLDAFVLSAADGGGLTSGRLLGLRIFSVAGSSVYNATPGTKSVIVEQVGAGGGSSGSPATSASQSGLSAPGSNGAYAKARYTSGFNGVTVTVGAAGTAGASNAAGGNGGTTSFGALLSCPGGKGGGVGVLVGSNPTVAFGGSASGPPSGSGILEGYGSVLVNGAVGMVWGQSSGFAPVRTVPMAAGMGASGVYLAPSSAAISGNVAEPGCVIVWEYA